MQYEISYCCFSHVGRVRSVNQDNFICDDRIMEISGKPPCFPLTGTLSSGKGALLGIFDGLGGGERGEIASYLAARDALNLPMGKNAQEALRQFCRKANRDICEYAEKQEVFSMGTTAALLAFAKAEIALCNIGDSKVFRLRKGNLTQLSQDHVSVAAYGVKPSLSQYLGIPPRELVITPYVAKELYHDGDVYLICSDGLTDMVQVQEIAAVLHTLPLEEAGRELLSRALSHGGKDNVSLIVCKIRQKSGWFFRWK